MTPTHVVKLKRTGFETIVASGSLAHCEERAERLNSDYQTDEYRIEPWHPSRAEHESAIGYAAVGLGVNLTPWQREVGLRILDGERVVMTGGRRNGHAMLRRVVAKAQETNDPEPPTNHTDGSRDA
ncbi:MAG: hypothetical protein CMH34_09875 [Microbacterium sp.]|nr:hypothetical protein [Microbacterium sp.]